MKEEKERKEKNERGRVLTSPETDKKKRNSLFRRPSLSRKKTKEENTKRAKSKDRETTSKTENGNFSSL
jgi:hypothetical protein